jgi:AcrR family transcriptional regulator
LSAIAARPREPETDRRVRRTRRALIAALLDLVNEKRYEQITVQDILERADVGRSTFYAHYVDKDALLLDVYRDLRGHHAPSEPRHRPAEAADPFEWTRGVFDWSLGLLHEFEAAGALYRSVVGSEGCQLAAREMEGELGALVRKDLARLAGRHAQRIPDMVVRFVVISFMEILAWWLDHPDTMSAEDVDRAFRVLALPGAAAALGTTIEVGDPPASLAAVSLPASGPSAAGTRRLREGVWPR